MVAPGWKILIQTSPIRVVDANGDVLNVLEGIQHFESWDVGYPDSTLIDPGVICARPPVSIKATVVVDAYVEPEATSASLNFLSALGIELLVRDGEALGTHHEWSRARCFASIGYTRPVILTSNSVDVNRACSNGHDKVLWTGGVHCWMCGEEGAPVRKPFIRDQNLTPYGWG